MESSLVANGVDRDSVERRLASSVTGPPPLTDLSSASTQPVLELRGISKQFPGVVALADVSFELRAGEVHVLVGENGAGKSTLVRILSGIYQPDAGEILLDGKPVVLRDPHAAQ